MAKRAKDKPERHELDCYEIDDLDEINGSEQLAHIWCDTHACYEWHSVPIQKIKTDDYITVTSRPVEV